MTQTIPQAVTGAVTPLATTSWTAVTALLVLAFLFTVIGLVTLVRARSQR